MQRKITAYVLVITLLTLNIFSVIALETPSFSIDLGALQERMIEKYGLYVSEEKKHTKEENIDARDYLKTQIGDSTYRGDEPYHHANIGIMLRYGVLVYTHDKDNHLDYKGFGDYSRDDNGIYQHRYLGLRKDCDKDAPVTNSLYPNVTGTTTFFSTYMNKNWQEEHEGNSESSWRLTQDPIRDYMLTDKGLAVQDSGVQIPNDSLSLIDIFKNKTGGSAEETMKYATFLAPSSLKYYGEVKGWHKVGAKPYYRTILVNPIEFKEPNLIIEFDKDQYVFAENEQTKTLTGTARLEFSYFKRIGNWKIADYIEKAYITIDGHEKKVNVIGDTITTDFSIEVDRDRFKIGKEQDFIIDGEYHLFAYEYLKGDEFVGDGVGATRVLVNPGEVEATFDIQYYEGDGQEKESVKGTTIAVETWDTYRLDLVPTIEVYGENEIENVAWVFESSDMNEVKNGQKDDMVRFIMDASKKETHLTDNKANFTMYVNLKYPFTDAEGNLTSQLVRTGWVEFIEGIPEDEVLPPQDMPPVAKLTVPSTIKQGELFKFSGGRSYDPDGEVVEYEFYGDMEIQKMYTESRGRATFLDAGEKDARLRVHDNDDLSDRVKETVEVLNAVEANMRIDGYRKANRRVTLNGEQSTGTHFFPINKYIWSIEPLEGQSMDSIKYDTDNTGKYCDVLFKESGAYQITLTAKADCTFTGEEYRTSQDTVSYPIVIQPDLPPVPQLNVYSLSLRDKMDSLQATIETVDTSYSSDGDKTRTEWYYCFDSDNDGSIADETWQSFGSGQNLDGVKVDHVGDYYFYNVTTDVIPPEETIERFLTASDYLSDSSIDNALNQHCLVDNVAPVIATSAELKKTVDLLVITDETDHYTDLVSEVYRLKKELFERKISLNDEVVTYDSLSKKSIGTKITAVYKWYRQVLQTAYWKYYVHRRGRYENKDDFDYRYITSQIYWLIDTLTGSVEDSKSFALYPNTVIDDNTSSIDIYNEPSDYFKTVDVGTFSSGYYIDRYNYDYYSQVAIANEWEEDRYNNIDQSPIVTYEHINKWLQGEKLSETTADFQVGQIDAVLSNYETSTNDKYLIFALENAENFYMTETQKNDILEKYGFKVYFSIDELNGEFMHETPPIKQFNVDNEGLHGLTKYGNQVVNNYVSNGSKTLKTYYDVNKAMWIESDTTTYPVSDADDYNYYNYNTSTLDDFITTQDTLTDFGFKQINQTQGLTNDMAYYTTGKLTNSLEPYLYAQLNISNASATYNAKWYRTYRTYKASLTNGTRLLSRMFYLKQGYLYGYKTSMLGTYDVYGTGCLVAPNDSETLLYVGVSAPAGAMDSTTGNSMFSVDTGIEKANVDVVYAAMMPKPHIDVDNVYIYREYGESIRENHDVIFNYNAPETMYIVKLLSGGYALVHEGNTYLFNSLSDFRGNFREPTFEEGYFTDFTDVELDTEASELLLPRTAHYGKLSYWGAIFETGYDYNERGSIIKNDIDKVFSYSLVTKDGELIVDNQKVADNATAGYSTGSMCVYADASGDAWGIGYTPKGELSQSGTFYSDFKQVFHSPYILNDTEKSKDFSCILDFVSRTPQALRTDRGDYATIIDAILEQYESYSTDETILVTVGDEVDMSVQVLDFESDPIIEKTVEITPVPNYFDNEQGVIDVPENLDKPFSVYNAGKAIYQFFVRDNPVGSNDLFDEFRYWNKDNTTITIIAHRKPIAKLTYDLVPVTDGVFTFIGDYTNSYDLDHSISRADKGIVDYRYYYRTEYQGEWTEFDGMLALERGLVYHFALQVKDLEGSWSDYDTADIEINGELFILNGSIDPPYPTGVPAGDTVTISADILTDKTIDTVTATIEGESSTVSFSKDSASGNNQVWSGTYTLPTSKADKDYYSVELTATASDGATRVYPLKINVDTPIFITGDIDPYSVQKDSVATITAETSLYADTCSVSLFNDQFVGTANQIDVALSKDSVSGTVQKWKATYTFDAAILDSLSEGEYTAFFDTTTANGNSATYTDTFEFVPNQAPRITIELIEPSEIFEGDDVRILYLPEDDDGDNLDIVIRVSEDGGATFTVHEELQDEPSGVVMETTLASISPEANVVEIEVTDPQDESDTATATFAVMPMSLENFRLKYTTDYDWMDTFFNSDLTPNALGRNGIAALDLPLYENRDNDIVALGYKVMFSIDSIALNEADDEIDIAASFYQFDGSSYQEVDLYVMDDDSKSYKPIESSRFSRSVNLTLDSSDRSAHETNTDYHYNTWNFEYLLPPKTLAVRKGQSLNLYDNNTLSGELLIVFDIVGVKASGSTFDYTASESTWGDDDGSQYGQNNPSGSNRGKGVNAGESFYYDLDKSSLDDIKQQIEW